MRLNGLISNARCMVSPPRFYLCLKASVYPGNCVPKAVKF
jgi:hypothetical protein